MHDDAQAIRFAAVTGHVDRVVQRRAGVKQDGRALFIDHHAVRPQHLHGQLVFDRLRQERFDANVITAGQRVVGKAIHDHALLVVIGLHLHRRGVGDGAPGKRPAAFRLHEGGGRRGRRGRGRGQISQALGAQGHIAVWRAVLHQGAREVIAHIANLLDLRDRRRRGRRDLDEGGETAGLEAA